MEETWLCLGLGMDGYYYNNKTNNKRKRENNIIRDPDNNAVSLGLSFARCSEEYEEEEEEEKGGEDRLAVDLVKAPSQVKNHKILDRNSIDTSNGDSFSIEGGRKKLRLSKDQSVLLEETFKIHRTLTPAQKKALADQLILKPRQVEVWFQNRRARSKLKQIELDFERLKKKCDALNEKNQRLEKELRDLRSIKGEESSKFVQLSDPNPTAFVLCSSCQKIIVDTERS